MQLCTGFTDGVRTSAMCNGIAMWLFHFFMKRLAGVTLSAFKFLS